jgi:cysteine desulfurase
MLKVPNLAISSGSACTSAAPHPSHVLLGIGLTEDQARTSLRFGIGRFNTTEEIDQAAEWIAEAYHHLVPLVA